MCHVWIWILKDKYLHTNCLATLANMAAYFRRLHPYTCQRLVTLLCVLNKRRTRVLTELKSSTTVPIDGNSSIAWATRAHWLVSIGAGSHLFPTDLDGKSKEDLELDLSILDEVLRMLLEILNAAFTHQLTSNQNLIYSILHKREVLDVLRTQDPFQDVVTNLDMVNWWLAWHGPREWLTPLLFFRPAGV